MSISRLDAYKYPAVPGTTCFLTWVSPDGQTPQFQIQAGVAASTRLLHALLSHPVSRRELLMIPAPSLGFLGYEHFVVANVVVAVMRPDSHTRLPAGDENRLRAVVADLRHQASVN